MAYRRTERVVRRLAARHDAILAAAASAAAEGGMAAVQVAPVAERAGIAAGTIYRYFPSKADLIGDLIDHARDREVEAMRQAALAAPGPLSAIAAAVAAFGQRSLANRKLAWALIGEPGDTDAGAARLAFRKAIAAELERLIATAAAAGLLPADPRSDITAPALIGAMVDGLIGPLVPEIESNPAARRREAVQTMTLLVLRALGVSDARARGLVVQTALPPAGEDAA